VRTPELKTLPPGFHPQISFLDKFETLHPPPQLKKGTSRIVFGNLYPSAYTATVKCALCKVRVNPA
ncbi:MAG: hypothetical protein LIO60_08020, partial [Oscillospiraceae bacterium]|nr:hypothetical protein [Oscillospiraceae bacterium]